MNSYVEKFINFIDRLIKFFIKFFIGAFILLIGYFILLVINESTNNNIWLELLVSIFFIFIILYAQKNFTKHINIIQKDMSKHNSYKYKILIFICCLLLIFIFSLLTVYITNIFANDTNKFVNSYISSSTNVNVAFILQSTLLAPILEELLFRGVFYNYLRVSSNNKIFSIILSSFIFSIAHGLPILLLGLKHSSNIMLFIILFYLVSKFVVGLILSTIYSKTQNLFLSILLHSFANIITFFI